jgi:hypothetical protein
MSLDRVYVSNLCILKNYFGEIFGDHYPYEVVTVIIMMLRDSRVLDFKTRLRNAVCTLPYMNWIILQMAQSSSNRELSNSISSYYPSFHAEYATLEDNYIRSHLLESTKDNINTLVTKVWFRQIVDDLNSEESLYELAMAGHTWIIEYEQLLFWYRHYDLRLFIDCVPTNTTYSYSIFTYPKTSWFK